MKLRHYPPAIVKTAPEWVIEDGVICLKFDGKGTHAILHFEALPRRGSYTISFDIKPTSTKSQTLFADHSYYIGSLVLRLDDGTGPVMNVQLLKGS